jgi:ubiquinone/menaquinone biosynthesis C-methylase UbiE
MNRFENWFCASSFWRSITRKQVLPWLLAETHLGQHVLEIGAGAGAATEELRRRAPRVTSLEYGQDLAVKLAARSRSGDGNSGSGAFGDSASRHDAVLRGDATALPFPNATFSAVLAVLMLHHLCSGEAQDQVLRESFRVLRPGGVFLALEIENSWLNRISHIRSTFVPLAMTDVSARFSAAGFHDIRTAKRSGAFRVRAMRPAGPQS